MSSVFKAVFKGCIRRYLKLLTFFGSFCQFKFCRNNLFENLFILLHVFTNIRTDTPTISIRTVHSSQYSVGLIFSIFDFASRQKGQISAKSSDVRCLFIYIAIPVGTRDFLQGTAAIRSSCMVQLSIM